MKIILQREVEKLGTPGDVVDVADGYARNFLLPRGMAIAATKGAVKHAERLKAAHVDRVAKAKTEAEAVASELGARAVRIEAQAGEEGRLFGSITAERIADEVRAQLGQEVDRKRVHLAEPIRSVGTHSVSVHLHPEVDAQVTVEVVPQA
ncbi:MAG TPA: 50S ribosomal protein L9 [Actinomycetota bacterium]|nr:50S ribosomal protein L9 [Actinomycetota bacterium]